MPWTIDSGALMGQVKELLLVTFTRRPVSPAALLDITALKKLLDPSVQPKLLALYHAFNLFVHEPLDDAGQIQIEPLLQ
jgi:hypothetical protein